MEISFRCWCASDVFLLAFYFISIAAIENTAVLAIGDRTANTFRPADISGWFPQAQNELKVQKWVANGIETADHLKGQHTHWTVAYTHAHVFSSICTRSVVARSHSRFDWIFIYRRYARSRICVNAFLSLYILLLLFECNNVILNEEANVSIQMAAGKNGDGRRSCWLMTSW